MPLDAVSSNELSAEQLNIIRAVAGTTDNLIVEALAGTGKTTVIRRAIPLFSGTVGIAAFGKKIATEVDAKVKADGNVADVGTFHSFGNRAVRRAFPKTKIEGKGPKSAGYMKFDRIADELEVPNHLRAFVRKAMDLGMQSGFGIIGICALNDPKAWLDLVAHHDITSELGEDNIGLRLVGREALVKQGCQLACKAIKLGVKIAHEVISFADMLYLPLMLDLNLPHFGTLCVDEAQDLNLVRIIIAGKMANRLFFVGDRNQSIFGFTGAENNSLDLIKQKYKCVSFPMTVTFRCAKAVVAFAQEIVPEYKAAEQNIEGQVTAMDEDTFINQTFVPGKDAIICRNTAPLVKAAYSLIRQGVPAHVEGKDIGGGLIALIDRFRNVKNLQTLKDKLTAYRDKEVAKLTAEKQEGKAELVADKVDTVFEIMSTLPADAPISQLRQDIADLFADTPDGKRSPTVQLMTAHRSKGLEFDRVFHYGRLKFFPSKFAKQDWQLQQERNLDYVVRTRAIKTYIDVEVAA